MKRIFVGFFSFYLSILAYAHEPLSLQVSSKQTSFTISLAANPTTGYQWSVIGFDKEILSVTSSVYQRPNTHLIGAGGAMLFTFSLNKGKTYPKTMNILFQYARPWEKNKAGMLQSVRVYSK